MVCSECSDGKLEIDLLHFKINYRRKGVFPDICCFFLPPEYVYLYIVTLLIKLYLLLPTEDKHHFKHLHVFLLCFTIHDLTHAKSLSSQLYDRISGL